MICTAADMENSNRDLWAAIDFEQIIISREVHYEYRMKPEDTDKHVANVKKLTSQLDTK